jgi:hypothetical protein
MVTADSPSYQDAPTPVKNARAIVASDGPPRYDEASVKVPTRTTLTLLLAGGLALGASVAALVLLERAAQIEPVPPGAVQDDARPALADVPLVPPTASGGPSPPLNAQFVQLRTVPADAAPAQAAAPSEEEHLLRAIVRDQDGKSISGADFTLLCPEPSSAPRVVRDLGAGVYEIGGLRRGVYMLRCRAPVNRTGTNFAKAEATVKLETFGEIKVVTYTFPRRGLISVEGYVVTRGGPAPDVQLVFESTAFESRAVSGAPDGYYRVEELPPGRYVLRAFYRDAGGRGAADLGSETLDIYGSISFTPLLEAGPLELTVAADAGAASARRRVELLRPEPAADETVAVSASVASGITDERGVLRLKYAPAGTYSVAIPGLVAEPAQITLSPTGTILTVGARLPRAPNE